MKPYRNELGFALRAPKDWSVVEMAGGLRLVPPDAAEGPLGPAEAYLVIAGPAPGIARPDDPRIGQYLDAAAARLGPGLARKGAPERLAAGAREGALFAWEGKNPQGEDVSARSYVVIADGLAIGLTAIGERPRLAAREAAVRAIFATFDLGAPDVDPALVGPWYRSTYSRSSYGTSPGDTFNGTSFQTMVLGPGGVLQQKGTFAFSAPAGGGEANRTPAPGRWGAANGRLAIIFPDGATAAFGYYVQGAPGAREMLLTPQAGGEKQLWTERAN